MRLPLLPRPDCPIRVQHITGRLTGTVCAPAALLWWSDPRACVAEVIHLQSTRTTPCHSCSCIHYTCLLPLGLGTYSPKCVSIGVPVLAAGIPTVPPPHVVLVSLQHVLMSQLLCHSCYVTVALSQLLCHSCYVTVSALQKQQMCESQRKVVVHSGCRQQCAKSMLLLRGCGGIMPAHTSLGW